MIQSKVMNKRSKVTKRQKVLLTSEMHFFSPASYDLAQMGVVLMDPIPLAVSRESALLLHRLSIVGHALLAGLAPPTGQRSEGALGLRGGGSSEQEATAALVDVDPLCGDELHLEADGGRHIMDSEGHGCSSSGHFIIINKSMKRPKPTRLSPTLSDVSTISSTPAPRLPPDTRVLVQFHVRHVSEPSSPRPLAPWDVVLLDSSLTLDMLEAGRMDTFRRMSRTRQTFASSHTEDLESGAHSSTGFMSLWTQQHVHLSVGQTSVGDKSQLKGPERDTNSNRERCPKKRDVDSPEGPVLRCPLKLRHTRQESPGGSGPLVAPVP
ncbi:unnamed protein product [Pleuronectes platessa]|uniref:Uncharacterized protein n=1 Tax=Pleuronectes platessa TaxID=8262 RepID=A0A9N7Z1P5_PLEPL|nr:unnamed protein product [Pleuronectes platessa]